MNDIQPSHENPSLLGHEQTQLYLKNLWDRDYGLGLYFSAMQELGDELLIPFVVEQEGIQKWYYAHHALYDGTSALRELNEVENLQLNTSESIPFKRISGRQWVTALKSALFSKPEEEHKFKNQKPLEERTNKFQYFSHQFSAEESTQIETNCKINKNSVTSLFLCHLARLCTQKFSYNKVTRWMIPVSIRGQVRPAPLSDLQASYIGVNYSCADSPKELSHKLVSKLKKGEYWGYWLISMIGLYLGRSFILYGTKKTLEKKKSLWFGSFSNVGDIGGESHKNVIIIHPVRWHRPIGATLYKHKNCYNIVLSVHESLEVSEQELLELKNDLCQSVLSK